MSGEDAFFDGVALEGEEQEWFDELYATYIEMERIFAHPGEYPSQLEVKAANLALKLYQSLISRGIEVEFPSELVKNRSVERKSGPNELSFYEHFHSIQVLVQYIKWKEVHSEIGDVSLGHEFQIAVFSWKSDRNYQAKLVRNDNGWGYQFMRDSGETDKRCSGFLKSIREIESIVYPHNIEWCFETLWEDAAKGKLDIGECQLRLNDLAKWISDTNKASPDWWR